MFFYILIIYLCQFTLLANAEDSRVAIRARRHNCGWAGYCGQQCCIDIQVQFEPTGGCYGCAEEEQQPCTSGCEQPCTSECQQQMSPLCCVGVQIAVEQPIQSPCCIQQYQQPCQCASTEPCCAEPVLPPQTLPPPSSTVTTTTTTYAPPSAPPPPPCLSCPVVQPAFHVNVIMQCVPACQPSCQPSCTAQPVNMQSQYNMATTSCSAQNCVCSMGYVQCAQQICCLRYRYVKRRSAPFIQ